MSNKKISINEKLSIPKIGLGTWQLQGQDGVQTVATALDMGYRCIDTAQAYDNEEAVGKGIAQAGLPRDQMFLVSKVWRDKLAFDDVIRSTEESLNRLKVDCIDLMLIHWPNPDVAIESSLKAFDKLKQDGKINAFGFANFTTSHLNEAKNVNNDFVCNQVEYHPYLPQKKILNWLQDNGKFLMAYSPLARGKVLKDDILQGIAEESNCDASQVALAWLMRQDAVMAIPKASSKEHLLSNLQSHEIVLSDEAIKKIDDLQKQNNRLIDPDFAPNWDRHEAL